ncbi:helix-turn-helix transcriptional regulator [Saccharopolyspora phatthalungensis]|uniref:AraC-like DNA-binding protein n=1 Tax=Saccharopolyspora phatthalungensis TaxID=664693 RepID=A0A840QJL4_9PSEU|nr:AraC family transcriptional regulator [Saccharopolyspora phatthalungensis]MBB5159458.1 AraC-like DNA-binding protein [Saccharopolyspora phatthalungensis]
MRHSGTSYQVPPSQPVLAPITITDPDEASSAFEAAYAPNFLTMLGRASRLELRLATSRLPLIDVGAVEISGNIRLEAPPPRSCCVVLHPRRGGVTISAGRESVRVSPDKLAFLPPGARLRYEDWGPDTELTTLRIDNSVLSSYQPLAAEHVLREPVAPLLVDLRDDAARVLAWVMRLLALEMRQPSGTLTKGVMAEHVSGLALSGLLSTLDPDAADPVSARSRVLRRALAAAEGDEYTLPSLADLAKAAAVSVRTLQELFRTELQTTPTAYLRQVRLRRAHQELVRNDFSRTTTEAVAQRWGFTNYGRFARLYRTHYGVSPSATLKRVNSEML